MNKKESTRENTATRLDIVIRVVLGLLAAVTVLIVLMIAGVL